MFIDTSVFVALLTGEDDAAALALALEGAETRRTSPLVRLEACAVLAARLDISPTESEALFDELLEEAEIVIDPIDDVVGRIAVRCFESYGKGRHPAALNIVDCFSYAGAKALGAPLLYKGNDFSQTDVNAEPDLGDTMTKSTHRPGWDAKIIAEIAKSRFGGFPQMFQHHGWPERGSDMMRQVQRRVVETYGGVHAFEEHWAKQERPS